MAAGGSWIMAVLPLQDPDRLVLGIGPRRDHVHYGSEVQVDAGRTKLLPPYGGPALEHPRRPRPLDDSGWYPGKAGPLHGLDQASFLVGGDEKPNVGGGCARDLGLHGDRHRPNPCDTRIASVDKPDRADVVVADHVALGRTQAVASQPQLKKLTDPLVERHKRKDAIGTGGLRS